MMMRSHHYSRSANRTNDRIGHFRLPNTVTFKTGRSAKPFSWKWVIFAWKQKNHFYINGFVLSLAWSPFKTEAWGKLEMARPLLGLQPRDKTAILVDKTIQNFSRRISIKILTVKFPAERNLINQHGSLVVSWKLAIFHCCASELPKVCKRHMRKQSTY